MEKYNQVKINKKEKAHPFRAQKRWTNKGNWEAAAIKMKFEKYVRSIIEP